MVAPLREYLTLQLNKKVAAVSKTNINASFFNKISSANLINLPVIPLPA
jgi:hypothetical protein